MKIVARYSKWLIPERLRQTNYPLQERTVLTGRLWTFHPDRPPAPQVSGSTIEARNQVLAVSVVLLLVVVPALHLVASCRSGELGEV